MTLDKEMFIKKISLRLEGLEDDIIKADSRVSIIQSRNRLLERQLLTIEKAIELNHELMVKEIMVKEGIQFEGVESLLEYQQFFDESREYSQLISRLIELYLKKFSLEVVHDEDNNEYLLEYTKEKVKQYEILRKNYLHSLHNALTFGKCAGKLTELPLLYKAGLKFEKTRKELEPEEKYSKFWQYIANAQKEKKLTQFKEKSIFPKFLFQDEGGKDKLKFILAKYYDRYSDPVEKNAYDGLLKIVETPIPINREVADSLNYICSKLDRLNDKTSEINNSDKYIKRTLELFGHSDEVDEIEAIGFLHDDGKDCIAKDIELKLYLRIANSPKIGSRFVKYNSNIMECLINLKNSYNNYISNDKDDQGRIMSNYRKLQNLLQAMRDFSNRSMQLDNIELENKKKRMYSSDEDIISSIQQSGSDGQIITATILGGPGQGKSTRIKQLAFDFVSEQLNSENPIIPIFFNAKEFAFNDDNGQDVDGSENLQDRFTEWFIPETITDYITSTLPEITDYLTKPEINELFELGNFIETQPFVLFVDALDECSDSKNIEDLLDILKEGISDFEFHVILTCRTTYKEYVDNEFDFVCKLEIPTEDLRHDMPQKLCDAWGITRNPIIFSSDKLFDKYKQVLTHPLFVGWFCMLISENRLKEYKPEFEADFDITLQIMPIHVEFLTTIIKEGIKLRLEDPTKPGSIEDFEKVYDILLLIAGNSIKLRTKNLDVILSRIKAVHDIEIEDELYKVIRENLGVAYEIGSEIEWTHKTIPEVAFAILLSHEKYSRYYQDVNEWNITTIIARAMQQAKDNKSTIVSELVSLIGEYHARDINTMLNIFRKSASEISKLDTTDCHLLYFKKQDSGEFTFEPAPVTEFGRLWHEIGCDYIERFNSGRAYPIAVDYWDLNEWITEENDEKGLPNIFYQTSNKFDLSDLVYYKNRQNSFIESDELRVFDYIKIFARAKPNDLENLRVQSVLRKVLSIPGEFFEEFPLMLLNKELVNRLKNDFKQSYADLTNKIVDLIQYIPVDRHFYSPPGAIMMHGIFYDWINLCLRNKIDVNMRLFDRIFLKFANGRFFRTMEENQIDILWEYLLNKHDNSVEILFNRLFIEDDLSDQSRTLLKHITSNVEPLKKFLIGSSENVLNMMLNERGGPKGRINIKFSKLTEVLFDSRLYDVNLKEQSYRAWSISNEVIQEIYNLNLPDFDREMIEILASRYRK